VERGVGIPEFYWKGERGLRNGNVSDLKLSSMNLSNANLLLMYDDYSLEIRY